MRVYVFVCIHMLWLVPCAPSQMLWDEFGQFLRKDKEPLRSSWLCLGKANNVDAHDTQDYRSYAVCLPKCLLVKILFSCWLPYVKILININIQINAITASTSETQCKYLQLTDITHSHTYTHFHLDWAIEWTNVTSLEMSFSV